MNVIVTVSYVETNDYDVLEANLKTALGTLQVLRRSPEKYDPNEGKKP